MSAAIATVPGTCRRPLGAQLALFDAQFRHPRGTGLHVLDSHGATVSTGDVGRASSLISATAVIAYLSLFGLNFTLVRFLPTAPDKGPLITAAFILVAGAGTAIGLAYILLTPFLAPRLAFVEHRPALTAGFALLTAAAAVNLLTDSVFIAARKASFIALTDGAIGGLSKIVFGVTLAGTGAYGLFCASAGGFAAAALVSVVLIIQSVTGARRSRDNFWPSSRC